MMATLDITEADGRLRAVIEGEIDLSNAEEIRREISRAMDRGLEAVTVDLRGVRYLDSSGLRSLFSLSKHAGALDADFEVLVVDPSTVLTVIDAVGLDAVAHLRRHPRG